MLQQQKNIIPSRNFIESIISGKPFNIVPETDDKNQIKFEVIPKGQSKYWYQ